MLKNGPKMAPKRVPKWAPEGRPRLPKDHMETLHRPAGSCTKPFFVVGFGFALVCVFGFGFGCLRACCCYSFVRWCCMSLCVLAFSLCVLFLVVVFLFYSFVFAMFEDCLTNPRATSKRHATCSRMSPSGLVEMLIHLEYVGSASVVMVPL